MKSLVRIIRHFKNKSQGTAGNNHNEHHTVLPSWRKSIPLLNEFHSQRKLVLMRTAVHMSARTETIRILYYFVNTNIDEGVEAKIPFGIFMVPKNFLCYIKWANELRRNINSQASSQQ